MGKPVVLRPNRYVSLDLTLIEYIETSIMCTSGVIRHIGNNTNVLG